MSVKSDNMRAVKTDTDSHLGEDDESITAENDLLPLTEDSCEVEIKEVLQSVIEKLLDKFPETEMKRNSTQTISPIEIHSKMDLNRKESSNIEENGIDLLKSGVMQLQENLKRLNNQLSLHSMQQNESEIKLSALEIRVDKLEQNIEQLSNHNRSNICFQDKITIEKKDSLARNSIGTFSDNLIKTEKRSEIEKSFNSKLRSGIKDTARILSHENDYNDRTDDDEKQWYMLQLEDIKRLPLDEIIQRILN
ncbi:unnamed protein product [Heterobilharzia americana]|nr:unnamed protein product [Heterobilharzia americana]